MKIKKIVPSPEQHKEMISAANDILKRLRKFDDLEMAAGTLIFVCIHMKEKFGLDISRGFVGTILDNKEHITGRMYDEARTVTKEGSKPSEGSSYIG